MFLLNVGAEGANPSKTLILGLSFMVFSLGGGGGWWTGYGGHGEKWSTIVKVFYGEPGREKNGKYS